MQRFILLCLHITLCLLLVSCASNNANKAIHDRIIGSWKDLRSGDNKGDVYEFHSDGSISYIGKSVGTYQVIPDKDQVEISFDIDRKQQTVLKIEYDASNKTDILIVNPESVPSESAMIPIFQKANNPIK
jgi:hypothetical protein